LVRKEMDRIRTGLALVMAVDRFIDNHSLASRC
jgi:hypothetical protein